MIYETGRCYTDLRKAIKVLANNEDGTLFVSMINDISNPDIENVRIIGACIDWFEIGNTEFFEFLLGDMDGM